jgi:hypothetical protein
LYFVAAVAWTTAIDIAEKIERGAVSPDPQVIQALVSAQLQTHQQTTSAAGIILIVCWFLGIAGSYWTGRQSELE